MIKQSKEYGVYSWNFSDNQTIMVFEADSVTECKNWIEINYKNKISSGGQNRIRIFDSCCNMVEKWNIA